MENFSEHLSSGAKIFIATNVLRCANNNNNLTKIASDKEKILVKDISISENAIGEQKTKKQNCSCVEVGDGSGVGVENALAAGFVEDEGGGNTTHKVVAADIGENIGINSENGAMAKCDPFENNYGIYDAAAVYDDSDEAAAVNFHSRNNSTDNLSYASDQFYAKDLIFLEDDYDDDDDNVAEVDDISLNSDDCVYAYRGDGADFDFPLDTIAGGIGGVGGVGGSGVGGGGNSMDDEMDFLEMDFDPDTLSEIENGGNSIGSDVATAGITDALLIQRDISQLEGRHSSSSHLLNLQLRNADSCTAQHQQQQQQQQRQLFSSPIDDLSNTAPMKVLQSQTLLGKNFGRMSLHLDQIKGGIDCNLSSKPLGCETAFERINGIEASNNISSSVGANHTTDLVDFPSTSAHSLPNTLYTFGREQNEVTMIKTSPSKVTGAKPKRLSTFSTSSSTSSKNSCKSRTSLRSVIGPSLYNSSSFDERSVSCTEFRSAPPLSIVSDTTALATSANGLARNQLDLSEDSSCLDCLEKEFLASTIGKEMEPINCPKCRRKRHNFSKSELRQQQHHHHEQQKQQSLRCRSGSPSFFTDITSDSLYELPHEDWVNSGLGSLSLISTKRENCFINGCMPMMSATSTTFKCDIINGEQLLKNLLTDKETVTISLTDVTEETLIRALDQFQIAYNASIIKIYFERLRNANLTTNLLNSNATKSTISIKEFKDLKHFLLFESKKNCNHPKIKRLIEYATQQQVEVQYKEDTTNTKQEMVNINVSDILRHWSRNNNILNLQELDQRFKKANIFGKIANIIRQTQTKRSSMRAQVEFIAIPQYYPNGFLILKKISQTQ